MLTRCPISTAIFLIVLVSIVSCAISPVLADVHMWMSKSVYALGDTITVYWDFTCGPNGGTKLTFVGPYTATSPLLVCNTNYYVAGVAEQQDVGDWVVYGEFMVCSDIVNPSNPLQCITMYAQTSFRVEGSPPPQVCSEGAVNVLEMCSDGYTWRHRQICRNNAWVDEYQQCPAQPCQPPSLNLYNPEVDGLSVRVSGVTMPGCSDSRVSHIYWKWGDGQSGDYWFPASHAYGSGGTYTIEVTSYQSDGQSTTRSVTVTVSSPPPVCTGGAVNVLEMCPDGSTWSHRQVCRNNAWTDEYQQCPTPPPVCSEGAVNVLETCSDGSWSHRQVCRNNAWVDEYQRCPTPSCPYGGTYPNCNPPPSAEPTFMASLHGDHSQVCQGEWIAFQLSIKNVGAATTRNVRVVLSLGGAFGGISEPTWNYPQISTDETKTESARLKTVQDGNYLVTIDIYYVTEMGESKRQLSAASSQITISRGPGDTGDPLTESNPGLGGVQYPEQVMRGSQNNLVVVKIRPDGAVDTYKVKLEAVSPKACGLFGLFSCLTLTKSEDTIVTAVSDTSTRYLQFYFDVDKNAPVGPYVIHLVLTQSIQGEGFMSRSPIPLDLKRGIISASPQCSSGDGQVDSMTQSYKDLLVVSGGSSIGLMVVDPSGRRVGAFISNGQWAVVQEIPDAYYSGLGSHPQRIAVPNPTSAGYRIVVTGIESGSYSLETTLTVDGAIASVNTLSGSVTSGSSEEHQVVISTEEQVAVVDPSPIEYVWYGARFLLLIVVLIPFAVGIALLYRGRRPARLEGSRPRVKEVRSTVSGPRVKSIQEMATGPRVLKVEDE